MKGKQLFKKWWFWVIVVVVLGGIGSLGQSGDNNTPASNTSNSQEASNDTTATLPPLNAEEYKGKEGLIVYKDLKARGYKVDAAFDNPAITDINGKATDVFEPLDRNKPDDRQSVDSFLVGDLVQDGDVIRLSIVKKSN